MENNEDNSPSIDARFQIKVSPDRLSVTLTQLSAHSGSGKPLTAQDILKKLAQKKVTQGIKNEVINEVVQALGQGEETEASPLVAEGIVAVNGVDSELEWKLDVETDDPLNKIVLPDQLLCVYQASSAASCSSLGRTVKVLFWK